MKKVSRRVLYCTDTYPPQVNGVSVVTAVSVAGMQQRGWECGVISPRYPKPYGKAFASDAAELAAVPLHEKLPSAPFPPYPDIRMVAPFYGRVTAIVREFQPDMIHCQTEFVIGRLGQMVAAKLGVPSVSSYHTDFSRYTEAYGVSRLRGIVSRYIARFHRRSKRVYTPSEAARDDLAAMDVRHVEVWGRGVDVRQFSPSKRSNGLREQLGVDGGFMFLCVGRLAPEKNVALVLDGFRRFRDANPHVPATLVVAGDGPAADELRSRASGNVSYLGNLERHLVLPLLYASADAFVYASETETLGLVILEAMASGVPAIAAPTAGIAVNLRDGVNGLAFPPGDAAAMAAAMERLVRDSTLRHRLARGARAWAEERSWSAELDRLDASYREILEPVRAARGEVAVA